MKLTKKIEMEVLKVYDIWLFSYLNGEVKIYDSYLDDEYHFIGSTNNEEFLNRTDTTKFFEDTAEQFSGKCDLRNENRTLEKFGEHIFITHIFDVWFLNDSLYNFYGRFRFTSILKENVEGWRFIYQHFSTPDSKTDEGETIGFEKVNEENQQLREAIKRRTIELEEKNRALKIEASLEKVRAVAMGMSRSEDLLKICEVLFKELTKIGFQDMRCALIHIFKDDKGYFDDYDYSDFTGGKISTIPYKGNTVVEDFLKQIRKSKDSFAEVVVKGKALEEFLSFRKKSGQIEDKRLFNAKEINYYFFSVGIGNIGISNFGKIDDKHLQLLKRFRNVFNLAYQRYADISLAEKQAREAKIEASLERVRSKTMAMHNSNDVGETVATIFNEFVALGIQTNRCGILIFKDEDIAEVWTAKSNPEGKATLITGKLQLKEHLLLSSAFDAWHAKKPFHQYILLDNDLLKYYNVINRSEYYPTKFDMQSLPNKEYHSDFFFPDGVVFSFTKEQLPDEFVIIMKRFAGVFGQTYRRYLDLRKAEAQARENQIQLALERARTQSMIMQHSNELDDTLRVFHEQVLMLGITSAFSYLWLPDAEKSNHIFWAAWAEEQNDSIIFKSKAITYPLDRNDPATAQCLIDWTSGEPVVSYAVAPLGVTNYFSTWQELIDGVEKLTPAHFTDGLYYVEAFMKYGCFGVILENDLNEDEKKILIRFALEFEQTYTRFLDLKKAEVQAKESQIQLALERVRARTMAMQKSEELKKVIRTVYQQLTRLNINVDHAGFVVDYTTGGDWHFWIADDQDIPSKITHPYFESVWANQFNHAKEKGTDFYTTSLNFEEKNKFYNELLSYVPDLPEASRDFYLNCPGLAASTVLFDTVSLYIENFSGIPYTEEENNILIRFGKVFQQTYTRFLDLQKAEAQAREAQIEASLERVRSRSMAMHTTSELQEVIHTVHTELLNLEISINGGSFIAINDDVENEIRCWGSGGTANTSEEVIIPRFEKPFYTNLLKGIQKGPRFFTEEFTQQEKKEFFTHLFKYRPWSKLSSKEKKEILSSPGGYTRSCSVSKLTSIFIINHFGRKFTDDENEILNRFAKVFEQTYTRFLDLQKAEAQAREAQIETALEKVRSRSLAMHKPDEIGEVVWMVVEKMKELNVALNGISLVTYLPNSKDMYHWHVNPEIIGNSSKMMLPYFDELVYNDCIAAREEGLELFSKSYTKKQKNSYFNKSVEVSDFKYFPEELKQWILEQPALSFSYAIQNNSGIFLEDYNGRVFATEENDLLLRFSRVFEQSYVRFLDLQKAEEQVLRAENDLIMIKTARKKAEEALTKLQQTQKQLIQSEKMASLGELTAGIAHEIQNPLNFVNNFSEVSNELLEEMMEEMTSGNYEEAKEILNDVKQNLEKINHHGKRADSIVKGMLQHSRKSTAEKELTDINKLADEYLRLAYHGLRAKDQSFNATLETDYDESIGKIPVISQDVGRVMLNLITNAFYAVNERKNTSDDKSFMPTVSIATKKLKTGISIIIKDNGNGIPPKVKDKIFQPFFTTKPSGQGTGLGLSLSYDIISAHGGTINLETFENQGTSFIIQLPNV